MAVAVSPDELQRRVCYKNYFLFHFTIIIITIFFCIFFEPEIIYMNDRREFKPTMITTNANNFFTIRATARHVALIKAYNSSHMKAAYRCSLTFRGN